MVPLPANAPVTITDRFDVSALVSYLRRSVRQRPTVVITASLKSGSLPIDPQECYTQADGAADVVVLRTRNIQQRFREIIGENRYIANGGIRIYPADDFWWNRPEYARYIAPYDAFEQQTMENVIAMIHKSARITEEEQLKRNRARWQAAQRYAADQASSKSAAAAKPSSTPTPAQPAGRNGRKTSAAKPAKPAKPRATSTSSGIPRNRIWTINDEDNIKRLGQYLLNPDRQLPVIVLTRAFGHDKPFADREKLVEEVGDIAIIADIVSPEHTWSLTRILPKNLNVYGGACRVYPTGDWTTLGRRDIPLFFAFTIADIPVVTKHLEAEAIRLHYHGGYSSSSSQTVEGVETTGTIGSLIADADDRRVLLQLDDGSLAWIYDESLPLELPAERLLKHGMRVKGRLQQSSHRFDLDTTTMRSADEALRGYQTGMTVLTRVQTVSKDRCSLELFPGFSIEVPRDDAGDEQDLRFEMRKGETVPARIVLREGDQWLLSVLEASDDDAIEPAPSVFPAGPPWIVPNQTDSHDLLFGLPRTRRYADTDVETLIPDGIDSCKDMIRGMYYTLVEMQRDLDTAASKFKASENSNTLLRKTNRKLRAANKALNDKLKASDPVEALGGAFNDEREQLDFEIRTAWALRIPADEKAKRPLCAWDYAPQFFESLHDLKGFDHGKIVDVIVEILTGLVYRMEGRDTHPLRTGSGGDDPERRTPQGEVYMRAALQRGAPGGRRIHFYKRRDGVVVLCSVRLHDDYRV